MKQSNSKSINDFLADKYGEVGSQSRVGFEIKANAYMIGELVKEAREKANLSQ